MTAGVLVSQAVNINLPQVHGHGLHKVHQIQLPKSFRHEERLKLKQRKHQQQHLIQHQKQKLSAKSALKSKSASKQKVKLRVRLKLEVKGRKYPNLVKKTMHIKLNKNLVKKVLVRQVVAEEKSVLKMLGVASFYSDLLKELKELKELSGMEEEKKDCHSASCPLCQCNHEKHDSNSSREALLEKLSKDVRFLLNYAATSTPRKEKMKYFAALNGNGFLKVSNLSEMEYLTTSDQFITNEKSDKLNVNFTELNKLREVIQGKRDALRLLKTQLLKTKTCGICESAISSSYLGNILVRIDQKLSSF